MKKLILVSTFMLSAYAMQAAAQASQTPGDALSGALHPHSKSHAGPTLPDTSLPVYLKSGSLICKNWMHVADTAKRAAGTSNDTEQEDILREGGCAVVPAGTRISLSRIETNSGGVDILGTFGLVKVSWHRSDGSLDSGFVGYPALSN